MYGYIKHLLYRIQTIFVLLGCVYSVILVNKALKIGQKYHNYAVARRAHVKLGVSKDYLLKRKDFF